VAVAVVHACKAGLGVVVVAVGDDLQNVVGALNIP
jgi:predicted transcriptional regulator